MSHKVFPKIRLEIGSTGFQKLRGPVLTGVGGMYRPHIGGLDTGGGQLSNHGTVVP